MRITPFGVEQWMNEYETRCRYNLAETCVDSLTVGELLDLSGHADSFLDEVLGMRLSYGEIEGSRRLRTAIAALYDRQSPDNVLVTHGAIGANHLAYLGLVEPGDHVVSVHPTYQQHYSIPESIGARVSLLRLRPENGWLPDPDELAALTSSGTKLVAINNPNNPTGALMDRHLLSEIAAICDRVGAYLLCDEVYRGIDQDDPGTTVSVADLYDRGISTGSMSKAFSLAGLRLGWVTGPRDVLARLSIHRDYSTISVGMVDDALASLALENAERILDRNRTIVRENLAALSTWIDGVEVLDWVRPSGGTTAFLRFGVDMASRDLCVGLLENTGVMLTPGSALEVEGYLRMGYANDIEVLREGLPLIGEYLAGLQ